MPNPATQMAFGYYPRDLSLAAGDIAIEPMPDLEQAIAAVTASPGIEADWIYPPPLNGKPYVSRIFGLPKTHVLRHARQDGEGHIPFLVWALSFFVGMRLTTTEMGFVDATPFKVGKLVDFVSSPPEIAKLLILADAFWTVNRGEPLRAKRVEAAIHALFLGQNPQGLQFERFIYLYTALDACFAMMKSQRPPQPTHAARVQWMCEELAIPTPAWAIPAAQAAKRDSRVSAIRNDTIHEALYSGEPLGFGLYGVSTNESLTLEMQALVCRLLIALIGAPAAGYVKTPVNTRQYHGLDL